MGKRKAEAKSVWNAAKKSKSSTSFKHAKAKYQKVARVPEAKYVDSAVGISLLNAGSVLLLNGMAEGTENTERIGRKICMQDIQYTLQIGATPTDLGTAAYSEGGDTVRVAIVYDKQSNGAAPAIADIWTNGGTAFCFGKRNLNNVERFQVLADEIQNISAGGPNSVTVKRYINCDLSVRYSGTGATIASINTGSLYLCVMDYNLTGASQGAVNGVIRVKYSDD